MTLGARIVDLRAEHHLSQGDLAEKLGVSRQSISKWETGSSIPDLDKLVALSELFSLSLDALVKGQEQKDAEPPSPQQAQATYPPQKIIGYILVGVGLLGVILGLAVNLFLLCIGGFLVLCGIACCTVKRHPGLVIGWGSFLPCAYYLPFITGANMNMVFHPHAYQDGLSVQLLVSYALWAILFLLIFATIKQTRAREHPFLLCGWVVFSQVYRFIPIAFQHGEAAMKYYVVLSWCVILFFLLLLFFTGKIAWRALKTQPKAK